MEKLKHSIGTLLFIVIFMGMGYMFGDTMSFHRTQRAVADEYHENYEQLRKQIYEMRYEDIIKECEKAGGRLETWGWKPVSCKVEIFLDNYEPSTPL